MLIHEREGKHCTQPDLIIEGVARYKLVRRLWTNAGVLFREQNIQGVFNDCMTVWSFWETHFTAMTTIRHQQQSRIFTWFPYEVVVFALGIIGETTISYDTQNKSRSHSLQSSLAWKLFFSMCYSKTFSLSNLLDFKHLHVHEHKLFHA